MLYRRICCFTLTIDIFSIKFILIVVLNCCLFIHIAVTILPPCCNCVFSPAIERKVNKRNFPIPLGFRYKFLE